MFRSPQTRKTERAGWLPYRVPCAGRARLLMRVAQPHAYRSVTAARAATYARSATVRERSRRTRGLAGNRGFTLIEMIIAVTLVAAILTGLLMAMRIGLTAYQKVTARLDANRRVMGIDRAMHRQFGGIMPVTAQCGAGGALLGVFTGDVGWMRFVSSSSFAEGAAGFPRIIEYSVAPDPKGGVRLMLHELMYTGPASIQPLCSGQGLGPVQPLPQDLEVAGRLAYCRFTYRAGVPDSPLGASWLPGWHLPDLPRDIRIDMQSLAASATSLPVLTLNIPVHVTRLAQYTYDDQ